jgi:hypothetical protein
LLTSRTTNTEIRWSLTAQSTGKSQATIVDAWARRTCRQVVSVQRTGAGGIRNRCRTRRIVDDPTRWPSVSNSPWIGWYPQRWLSRAMRSINAAIASLRGGRPMWWGYVHFVATRRGCQRRIVPGVTTRCTPQHLRQPPEERGEHRWVRPVQVGLGVGCAQHGDFVTQHQEFDVLGLRRAAEQQQQVHKLEEDQVEQAQGHGSRSCPRGRAHRSHRSEVQADFRNPTGLRTLTAITDCHSHH